MRAARSLLPWLKRGWEALRGLGDVLHLHDILDFLGAYSYLVNMMAWLGAMVALVAGVVPFVVIGVAASMLAFMGWAQHRNLRHNMDHERFMKKAMEFARPSAR